MLTVSAESSSSSCPENHIWWLALLPLGVFPGLIGTEHDLFNRVLGSSIHLLFKILWPVLMAVFIQSQFKRLLDNRAKAEGTLLCWWYTNSSFQDLLWSIQISQTCLLSNPDRLLWKFCQNRRWISIQTNTFSTTSSCVSFSTFFPFISIRRSLFWTPAFAAAPCDESSTMNNPFCPKINENSLHRTSHWNMPEFNG